MGKARREAAERTYIILPKKRAKRNRRPARLLCWLFSFPLLAYWGAFVAARWGGRSLDVPAWNAALDVPLISWVLATAALAAVAWLVQSRKLAALLGLGTAVFCAFTASDHVSLLPFSASEFRDFNAHLRAALGEVLRISATFVGLGNPANQM